MKDFFLSLLCIAVVFMAVYARSEETAAINARFAVPAHSVTSALEKAGIRVYPEQVQFLSKVTSSEPHAELKVRSVQEHHDGSAKATLQCVNRTECVPFIVLLHWSSKEVMKTQLAALPYARAGSVVPSKKTDWLTMPGDHATLLMEAKGIRISTPVICLERGVQNQKIRVTSADHKHIYIGEVLDRGLLRSAL